jgi:hypothetical protein
MKLVKTFEYMAYVSFGLAIFPWVFFGVLYSGPVPLWAGPFMLVPWPISAILALIALVGLCCVKGCFKAKVFAALALLVVLFCVFITVVGARRVNEFYKAHPPAPRIYDPNR